MQPAETQDTWLTYSEAATRLGCSTKTIQRRVREGTLKPHYYPGRRSQPVLAAADVNALLEPQPAGVTK